MPPKNLKRVLELFLGDFMSRRSEYRRYWLFGFLTDQALDLKIDLLVPASLAGSRPVDVLGRRAEEVFISRTMAASLNQNDLTSACLTIWTQGEPVDRRVGAALRRGREVTFRISVVYKGEVHEIERARFVAHHDPAVELKSEPPFDEGEGRDT